MNGISMGYWWDIEGTLLVYCWYMNGILLVPSGNQTELWKIAIEIVDFPMENWDFP